MIYSNYRLVCLWDTLKRARHINISWFLCRLNWNLDCLFLWGRKTTEPSQQTTNSTHISLTPGWNGSWATLVAGDRSHQHAIPALLNKYAIWTPLFYRVNSRLNNQEMCKRVVMQGRDVIIYLMLVTVVISGNWRSSSTCSWSSTT